MSLTRLEQESVRRLERCSGRGVFGDRGMIKTLTVAPTLQTNGLADMTFSCADDIRKWMIVYGVMLINIRFPAKADLEDEVLSQGTLHEETYTHFEVVLPSPAQRPIGYGTPKVLESLR